MALMKTTPHTTDESEELFAPQETGNLSVNADNISHILSRLTDMYSDPILASARETISNALDATMKMPEADRKPVEINVGTFDSTFTVRDYGVGMTEDEVKNNFLRYGSSTKTDDFDQVGAWGLGSKSPLAYTSEFTVTTTKNGVTTAFKMSNTAAGFQYKILYTRETGRDSGTIVAIPMLDSDAQRFLEIANRYQKFAFDLPLVVNSEKAKATEYLEVGEIVLDEDTDTRGRVWIKPDRNSNLPNLQNNFSFLLSGYKYRVPNDNGNNAYYGYSRGYDESIIVELKPALVDFTSSRDDIANTERSKALVKKVSFDLQKNDFQKNVMVKILESDFTFMQKYNWVNDTSGITKEIADTHELSRKIVKFANDSENNSLIYGFEWHSTKNPQINLWGNSYYDKVPVSTIVEKFSEYDTAHSSTRAIEPRYGHYSRRGGTSIVITGLNKDNVRKALSARARWVRGKIDAGELSRVGNLVFRQVTPDQDILEIEELLEVKTMTVDELIEEAKGFEPKAKSEPKTTILEGISLEGYKEGMKNFSTSDLDELAKSKPVIVLTTLDEVRGLYADLDNREIINDGDKVYFLKELQLRVYEALKDTAKFLRDDSHPINLRAKTVREAFESFDTVKQDAPRRAMKTMDKSDLAMIAFAPTMWYRRPEDIARVLTAALGEEIVLKEAASRYIRVDHYKTEAAREEFTNQVDPSVRDRYDTVLRNFDVLVSASRSNPDSDLNPLIDALMELPNKII